MKKHITAIIGLLLIMFYCSSCAILEGPDARETRKANRYLRKANRFIRKAEQHGAVWRSDTLFKKLNFKVPGIEVKFIPKVLTAGKPMIFRKDSVITKVLIVPGKNGIDTVYVETKCPDREIIKIVPVEINNKLSAAKSKNGSWIAGILATAIVFFVSGYLVRSRNKVTVQIEKPANLN